MAVTTRTNALSTRDLDDMGVEIQNCQDTNDDNARFMSVMRERSIVLGSASPIEATLIAIMSTIGSCKKRYSYRSSSFHHCRLQPTWLHTDAQLIFVQIFLLYNPASDLSLTSKRTRFIAWRYLKREAA